MNARLTVDTVKATIPKAYKKNVTQDVIDEINLLAQEPDYGEEFKEAFSTFTTVLGGKEAFSLTQYVNAVKFYSLTATGLPYVKAYVKVFPERLQARLDRGQTIDDMGGEASRYNSSDAVNKIRAQALVPLHLVNQGTTQRAINVLVDIAVHGRSEVARVTAAGTLLKELRPPESQHVELQIGLSDEVLAAQNQQNQKLIEIAENQRKIIQAGGKIEDVQQLHVTTIDAEIDEDE